MLTGEAASASSAGATVAGTCPVGAGCAVRVGDCTLMASEASPQYPPMPAAFYLYVADADASMQRALAHGAALEMEVTDMPYGDRQGGARDPHGNLWWISQRVVEAPYAP